MVGAKGVSECRADSFRKLLVISVMPECRTIGSTKA